MKQIQLTKGKYAKIDDDDFEFLSQWKWLYGGRRYAVRNIHSRNQEGKRITKVVWMHREIMKTPDGLMTDHINGDTLDNRKSNLRIVTAEQNVRNSNIPSHNTSGFKGVSETKRDLKKKWEAYITANDKKIHLGRFSTKEEAAEVYNKTAKKLFGEYARLNNLIFFEYECYPSIESVRQQIKRCESFHMQQSAYSTFHDCLTQVCFGCRTIRTSIKIYEQKFDCELCKDTGFITYPAHQETGEIRDEVTTPCPACQKQNKDDEKDN